MSEKPRTYTPEIGAEICNRVVCGETLKNICRDPHMPPLHLAHYWSAGQKGAPTDYAQAYARARLTRAHALVEEAEEIADNTQDDINRAVQAAKDAVLDSGGDERKAAIAGHKAKREAIESARIRIDMRKWAASRMNRKAYGERIGVVDETPPEQVRKTVDLSKCTTEQLEQILKIAEGLPDVSTGS